MFIRRLLEYTWHRENFKIRKVSAWPLRVRIPPSLIRSRHWAWSFIMDSPKSDGCHRALVTWLIFLLIYVYLMVAFNSRLFSPIDVDRFSDLCVECQSRCQCNVTGYRVSYLMSRICYSSTLQDFKEKNTFLQTKAWIEELRKLCESIHFSNYFLAFFYKGEKRY